ncbi:MAG: allophanate hydrolase subunit 1 [Geminicoccaceae bacterium]|nr:allophanate hydrolase subunit 1 [Geminicoccaceae bacterium]
MISRLGLTGALVSFGDRLDEEANRAAVAFRARIEAEDLEVIEETSTSLTSVFVRFDALRTDYKTIADCLLSLLEERDWMTAELPVGRRLWRIPVTFGGEHGPQLEEVASLAGVGAEQAVQELTGQNVRVLALGFAPGQPYLGILPEHWNIPRQAGLTPQVPEGALVVAVRQFVLFTIASPTGWRQVGRTAFRCFRPAEDPPFPLRPGDEVRFVAVSAEEMARIEASTGDGSGGAMTEPLP